MAAAHRRLGLAAITIGVLILAPTLAPANSVTFIIERISDTLGRLSGSGSFDAPTPSNSSFGDLVFLIEPFGSVVEGGVGVSDNTLQTNLLKLLNTAEVYSETVLGSVIHPPAGPADSLLLNFNGNPTAGETISGSADVTLNAGTTWAPVGTTGQVWYGRASTGIMETRTGSFRIVAAGGSVIPEPITLICVPLGLMGAGFHAARRRAGRVLVDRDPA